MANQPRRILFTIAVLFGSVLLINSVSLNGCALERKNALSSCPSIQTGQDKKYFTPDPDHPEISDEVVYYLKNYHYKKQDINNALSEKILEKYLSDLDWSRLYFLQSDIDDFQALQFCIDDALKQDDLNPAYMIFNRYQRRVIERLTYVNDLIENRFDGFNFQLDESIQVDRKKAPWAAGKAELDDLWRKRIKNEVLNLKLSGKKPEKIRELLLKRYKSQLNRIRQRNSEDVFRYFMNSVAQLFDPHTQYFSPRVSENFDILMKLSLEGIGAVLQSFNEFTKIVRLIPAGPAEKSGQLKPGDRIVGVGQGEKGEMVDVIGWRLDEVVDLIRGPKKTVVRLEVIPVDSVDETRTRRVRIIRDTVKLEEQAAQERVETMTLGGRTYTIGIIDIPTFYIDFSGYMEGKKDYKSTTRDVRRLLKDLQQKKIDGLIIDLRENGGGALEEAKALTGLFIKDGPVVQVRRGNGYAASLKDPDKGIAYSGPLIVLVNRMSASASEIFAGAIQDYHRGIIIGTQTYGKGTVQTLENLKKGQLKITRGKFYRVSGESTQNRGVLPDILFPEVYDKTKIGESSLPDSLPWDTIGKVRYKAQPDLSSVIKQLVRLHEQRAKGDPGFQYLRKGIERLRKAQEEKWISLNETTRKKEREISEKERFELENLRRSIQGEKPLQDLSEMETIDEEAESMAGDPLAKDPKKKDRFDPMMTEAEKILLDFIQIKTKQVAGKTL